MNKRGGAAAATNVAACVTLVAAGCGVAACASGAPSREPAPMATSASKATETTASAVRPPCSNASSEASWSIPRRAAQLVVLPALDGNVAALASPIAGGVGGVLLLGQATPPDLAGQVAAADRNLAAPLLVMADEEGGGVQRLAGRVEALPWARQMAASSSPGQVRQAAARVAAQMKILGVNVDLAPVLDLDGGNGPNSSDADGLRSFSPDPERTSVFGLAFADGLRSGGVLPVLKHFPGLGGATPNTDYGAASTPSISSLRKSGLLPFATAIKAGAAAVMVANASVPGLTTGPASVSSAAIEGLLRTDLGFRGLVMTDSLSAGAIAAAGYDVPAAAVAAVAAGADMVLFGSTLTAGETRLLSPPRVARSASAIVDALARWAAGSAVAMSRLDDAVQHVLTAKGVELCSSAPAG